MFRKLVILSLLMLAGLLSCLPLADAQSGQTVVAVLDGPCNPSSAAGAALTVLSNSAQPDGSLTVLDVNGRTLCSAGDDLWPCAAAATAVHYSAEDNALFGSIRKPFQALGRRGLSGVTDAYVFFTGCPAPVFNQGRLDLLIDALGVSAEDRLTLWLIWPGQAESDADLAAQLDQRMHERGLSGVAVHSLWLPVGEELAALRQLVREGTAFTYSYTLAPDFTDDAFTFSLPALGKAQLELAFPINALPDHVTVTAENGKPATYLIDRSNGHVWLTLTGAPGECFTIALNGGGQPQITVYTEADNVALTVTDVHGQPVAAVPSSGMQLLISGRIDFLPPEELLLYAEQEAGSEEVCRVGDGVTGEDGVTVWTAELLPMAPGTTVLLTISARRKGTGQRLSTIHSQPCMLTVANQPPMLNDDVSLDLTLYLDVPGQEAAENKIDLTTVFSDLDPLDLLTYTADLPDTFPGCLAGTELLLSSETACGPMTFSVTATDACGEAVTAVFTLTAHSVAGMLDDLRAAYTGPAALDLKAGESTVIAFSLAPDMLSAYAALTGANLPALEDALSVAMTAQPLSGDLPFPAVQTADLIPGEDGSLTAVFMLPVSPAAYTAALTFAASLTLEGIDYPLPALLPVTTLDVVQVNTAPAILCADAMTISCEVDDLGGDGCLLCLPQDGIPIADLFSDNETPDVLQYILTVDGQSETVPGDRPCRIRIEQAGVHTITLTASDGALTSAPVTWSVQASSGRVRKLTMAGATAAAILLVIAAVIALLRRHKPSFVLALRIGTGRGAAQEMSFGCRIGLHRYAREPVSMLTLLIDSGTLIPRGFDPRELEAIVLRPEKNDRLCIACPQGVVLTSAAGPCSDYAASAGEELSMSRPGAETITIRLEN